MNLHAHIATATADCDGPMYRDYTVFPNDDERAEHERQNGINDFSDLRFKERILGSQVSFHADSEVLVSSGGFSVSERTDEGYRRADVTWCEDDCTESYSQRDIYAEMMGY